MSVMSCISGLESMSIGSGGASKTGSAQVTTLDDGYCITERYAAADAIQKIGGLQGLSVTMHKLGVLISGPRCGRVDGPRVASMGRVVGSRRWRRVHGSRRRRRRRNSRVAGRRHFLFMNLDVYYPPLPLDILEVLTRGLVERVCDGRLEEGRAAEIAVRRAWILLECGVSLPLTPADADRVYGLIHYQGL